MNASRLYCEKKKIVISHQIFNYKVLRTVSYAVFEIKPVRRTLTDNNSIGLTDFKISQTISSLITIVKYALSLKIATFGLTGLDNLFRTLHMYHQKNS